jgi:hypothetical protein
MAEWTIDISKQKKGSGFIVLGYNKYTDVEINPHLIFVSAINAMSLGDEGISIQTNGTDDKDYDIALNTGQVYVEIEDDDDRKAIFDFILKEKKDNAKILENISKQTLVNNAILQNLLSETKAIKSLLTEPTPKKSQTASILKRAGFA